MPDAPKAKEEGYKGYKIHAGSGQHKDGPPIPGYVGHMKAIKPLRKALGDEFVLIEFIEQPSDFQRFEAVVGLHWIVPAKTLDAHCMLESVSRRFRTSPSTSAAVRSMW